jgi:hypothetical protein
MDPYIEAPHLWSDFHSDLAAEIRAALNAQIRPRYIARMTEYVTYEIIEIAEKTSISPDVSVWQTQPEVDMYSGSATLTITPPSVESLIELEAPLSLYSVEMRVVETKELVTVIEILSPVNKRPGHKAYRDYRRKRQELLRSPTHFMEIDLLRGGERSPLKRPVPLASWYVSLSRATRRPTVEVWSIQLKDKLPVLPVPLLEPDPDVALDLGAVVASVYERGGYDTVIDYRQAPPPPAFLDAEFRWLDEHLRSTRHR